MGTDPNALEICTRTGLELSRFNIRFYEEKKALSNLKWIIKVSVSHLPVDDCIVIEEDIEESFSIIVSEQQKRDAPLTFLRDASQVCSAWRGIILQSPSVWANSLDLAYLSQDQDHWRNEVLRRTGNAALTLVGCIDPENAHRAPFVCSLVEKHWERMQSLILLSRAPGCMEKLHAFVSHPAPILEEFQIIDMNEEIVLEASGVYNIFSGRSPRLNSFFSYGMPFQFGQSSCFSNIRNFKIAFPDQRFGFTALEFLRGLQEMHLLTTLEIEGFRWQMQLDADPGLVNVPLVSLPYLKLITINRGMGAIFDVVSNISVPLGCTLKIIHNKLETLEAQITAATVKILKNSFNRSKVGQICYALKHLRGLDETLELHILLIGSDPEVHLRIFFIFDIYSSKVFPSFLFKALAQACAFDKTNVLLLSLDELGFDTMTEYVSTTDIADFFGVFQSTVHLCVDKDALDYLLHVDSSTERILFPKLKRLECETWTSEALFSVAIRRHEAGYPIKEVLLEGNKLPDVDKITFYIPPGLSASPFRLCIGWVGYDDRSLCEELFVTVEKFEDLGSHLDSILSGKRDYNQKYMAMGPNWECRYVSFE